jgi:multicomponent Na+:H+ antiporter subunit D
MRDVPEHDAVRRRTAGLGPRGDGSAGGVAVEVAVAVDTSPRALPRLMLGATAAMTAVGLAITIFAGPLFTFTQKASADLLARTPYVNAVLPEEARR